MRYGQLRAGVMSARSSLGTDCLFSFSFSVQQFCKWKNNFMLLLHSPYLHILLAVVKLLKCDLGYSLCLSLYPDSQPEYPLCLGSAAELLSGEQQQSRQKHCLIRHWGWWPQPIFFPAKQASLSAPYHLLWDGRASPWSFFGFSSTPVKKTWRLPGVRALSSLKMSHLTSVM